MKTNALYISAIALLAAISCAKETEISQEEPVVIKNPKVIVAKTDDDITTKTSLSGVSVIWATTDVIMGWDGSGKYNSSSTAVKDEGKKATFTFSALSVEDDLYYLVYPASAVTKLPLLFPQHRRLLLTVLQTVQISHGPKAVFPMMTYHLKTLAAF